MKSVVGYIRVSTAGQVEDGAGLEIQRSRISEYCIQNKLSLGRIYEDRAMSGAMRDRPALLELLKDVGEDRIKQLIVYRQDRLSREMGLTIFIDNKLTEHGVQLTSILEPIIDLNGDSLTKLIRRMLALMSEYERELISSRLSEGRWNNARKGERGSGPIPYGYRKVGDKLLPDENESLWVVKMFRWTAKGVSYTRTIEHLNKHEVKTKRGKQFSIESLKYVLRNPVYFGQMNFGSMSTTGVHAAIVTKRLFRSVQKKIENLA